MDMPPIPPAVVQFAKDNKIENIHKDEIFRIKKMIFKYDNISDAYCGISEQLPEFEKQKDFIYTHCTYILVENGNIRLATPEETEKLNRALFL